jgi:hypothetical protein
MLPYYVQKAAFADKLQHNRLPHTSLQAQAQAQAHVHTCSTMLHIQSPQH